MKFHQLFNRTNKADGGTLRFPHRVAIIDIGSNSIKLRIYEVFSENRHDVLFEDKNMVRLGEQVFETQNLPDEVFQQTADILLSYQKLIESFDVQKTLVKATAAVRSAKNVEKFIRYIRRHTKMHIDVLSGIQEAEYAYLASISAFPYKGRTILLADIGGGSTEICIATEKEILFSTSLPLGTVRLLSSFFADMGSNGLYSPSVLKTMDMLCQKWVGSLISHIQKHRPEVILAFGGTPTNIAEVAVKMGQGIERDGCIGLSARTIAKLYQQFSLMSPKQAMNVKGLDPKRADIVLTGLAILNSLVYASSGLDVMTSDKGLREGIMLDYIYRSVNQNIYAQKQHNFRLYAIINCAEKFNINMKHGEQVAELASQLFLQLDSVHQLPVESLALLVASAYLHDAGILINYRDHHKHSYYLINNSDLLGFSKEEKKIIGLVACYHRKKGPQLKKHKFKKLDTLRQQQVLSLSAIIRLADALDRSYQQNISIVNCALSKNTIKVSLESKQGADIALEIWSFNVKKEYAEAIWKKKLRLII